MQTRKHIYVLIQVFFAEHFYSIFKRLRSSLPLNSRDARGCEGGGAGHALPSPKMFFGLSVISLFKPVGQIMPTTLLLGPLDF